MKIKALQFVWTLVGIYVFSIMAPLAQGFELRPVGESMPPESLFNAAKKGDIQTVRQLIASGANLEETGKHGATPLIIAAERGRMEVVVELVKAGANIHATGEHDVTVLLAAADSGEKDVVEYLINSGAKIDFKGDRGATLLAASAYRDRVGIIKILLAAGADYNGTKLYKRDKVLKGTPLMIAAEGGSLKSAMALVRAGTDPNFQGDEGFTALMLAAKANEPEIVALLLGVGADATLRNSDGKTGLDIAKAEENNRVVKMLEAIADVPPPPRPPRRVETQTPINLELGINRPGQDIRSVKTETPKECHQVCAGEPECVSFTWVQPGIQGPSGVCWIKRGAPDPKNDSCCVSGLLKPEPIQQARPGETPIELPAERPEEAPEERVDDPARELEREMEEILGL